MERSFEGSTVYGIRCTGPAHTYRESQICMYECIWHTYDLWYICRYDMYVLDGPPWTVSSYICTYAISSDNRYVCMYVCMYRMYVSVRGTAYPTYIHTYVCRIMYGRYHMYVSIACCHCETANWLAAVDDHDIIQQPAYSIRSYLYL